MYGGTLAGVERLPQLNEITFFRPGPEVDFGVLATLPGLRQLEITSPEREAFDLARLPALPQVIGLTLGGELDLTRVDRFPNVETLYLPAEAPTSLAPLGVLTHLKTLRVNARGKALSGLDALPKSLEELSLTVADMSQAGCPGHLPALRRLKLDSSAQLGCLGGLPKLVSLEVSTDDLSAFATGFPALTALTLYTSATDLAPLGQLGELEYLVLHAREATDFSPLAHLTKLTWLGLGGCKGLATLHWVTPLVGLQTLAAPHTAVTDISPIASLVDLTALDLKETDVADIKVLSGLRKLESVNLSFTKVRSLVPLYDHPALTSLGLHLVRVPRAQLARVKRGTKGLTIDNKRE